MKKVDLPAPMLETLDVTPLELAFVDALVEQGNVKAAGASVGLVDPGNLRGVYSRSRVKRLIMARLTDKLDVEGAVTGLHTLLAISSGAIDATGSARVEASRFLLTNGLLRTAKQSHSIVKSPSEMTRDELREHVEGLKRMIADSAKPVLEAAPEAPNAPDDTSMPDHVLDMFD